MIVKAQRVEIERERVDDDVIRESETALGHRDGSGLNCRRPFGITAKQEAEFVEKLREIWPVTRLRGH